MNQEQLNALMQAMVANGLTQEETQQVAQSLINQQASFEQAQEAVQQLLASRAQPEVTTQPNVVAQPAQTSVGTQTSVGLGNLLAIAQRAGAADDHGVVRAGFAPAEAGFCTMRLKGYVEVGVHAPTNPKHKNREMVHVLMEVNTPQHLITEDGVQKPREIVIRTPKAHSNNAGFPRLFAALNACHGNKYHHIGEMIGEAFVGEIYHSKPDGNQRVWENFDNDKVWSFKPTTGNNVDGTTYSIDVPPLVEAPMFFVFDNNGVTEPSHVKQLWDSIYIAGTRQSEKNGQTVQTSKNYYQELIRASITWDKSKTKQYLTAVGCPAETLTAIAPKRQVTQQAEQAVSADATLVPATVQPVSVQPQMGLQPQVVAAQPAVVVQSEQTLTVPELGVQPQVQPISVDVNAAEPQVVSVSPTFVAPQTEQQKVEATPTVAQPQVTAQPAEGTDVNAWLNQFAAQQ